MHSSLHLAFWEVSAQALLGYQLTYQLTYQINLL